MERMRVWVSPVGVNVDESPCPRKFMNYAKCKSKVSVS
jgi:hypothetical protein